MLFLAKVIEAILMEEIYHYLVTPNSQYAAKDFY